MERPSRIVTSWPAALLAFWVSTLAAAQPTPVTAETIEASHAAAPLRLSGTFTARQRADLSPAVAGLIQTLAVDVGDRVDAGTTLLGLDPELAELQLARLQAAAKEAEALRDEAQRQAQQARVLAESGDLSASLAQTRAAEAATAEARLASRQAEVREQAARLRRHRLQAPFAGVVTRRYADIGEWAVPGTPVLELVDLTSLRLDVPVPQARFAAITPDTRVTVTTPALPDQTLDAAVAASVPVSDPAARTLRVRLTVDNPEARLLPGMSAQAEFHIRTAKGLVLAPRDALVRRPEGGYGVWVVQASNGQLKATARPVRTGRTVGNRVEIREGLTPGDRVIVRGNEGLSEGQVLRLVDRMGQADP